jgi:hypothetical protein
MGISESSPSCPYCRMVWHANLAENSRAFKPPTKADLLTRLLPLWPLQITEQEIANSVGVTLGYLKHFAKINGLPARPAVQSLARRNRRKSRNDGASA